jgi:murein DD-endopeptidase MepM/ murein hydrolase activator NlpD
MYSSSTSALVLLAGILVNLLPLWAFEAPGTTSKAKAADSWSVSYKPLRLVNGSPIVFHVVSPEPLKSLDGKWLEHEVFFSSDSRGKVWYGLAGASLEIRPGNHSLELKGVTATGKDLSFQKQIAVGKGKYHSIAASVPKISDVFGTSRIFNGKVQSVHQGLDYAVPEGTPVAAVNSGTVVLAQPLYFEGNCVVLDHGQGLLTLYMHLSKIEVKEGDRVTSGQKLGVSGGTGRATGPHLHVAVRWQGVYLNPETLLSLQLP